MKLVLDAKELAVALSLPVTTIQQYASKYPEKLPPRLNTPSRKLMWSVKDVEAWIEQYRASVGQAPVSSGCSTPGVT
jgi:predicted DNA-binding transcriptional regulator AlpA